MYSISNIPSQAAQDIRDLYALGVFHRSLSPCRPHIAQVDHRTPTLEALVFNVGGNHFNMNCLWGPPQN